MKQNPNTCLRGSPGLPGRNGVNGHNGSQAATAEMELKVKRAWQVLLVHVVRREKGHQVEQTPITETGNSARGGTTTGVTLD